METYPYSTLLLHQVTIPKYIREVQISRHRNSKYFELKNKDKLPKKYRTPDYVYKLNKTKTKTILYTLKGEAVIANPKVSGTPRFMKIKGNDIWYGHVKEHTRNNIIIAIKKSFMPYLSYLTPIIIFPILIKVEIQDAFNDESIKNKDWDLDNRWLFYGKALQDLLTDLKIIPGDDRRYVTGVSTIFTPIDNTEDRKFIISIFADKREVIKDSKYY